MRILRPWVLDGSGDLDGPHSGGRPPSPPLWGFLFCLLAPEPDIRILGAFASAFFLPYDGPASPRDALIFFRKV